MITELRLQNFKSWKDTGPMRFAPLTGFFGTNSSGKSAILQFLLMLKQTVESADRNTVLAFNGPYTELGTFRDVVFGHQVPGEICYSLNLEPDIIGSQYYSNQAHDLESGVSVSIAIQGAEDIIRVKEFDYSAYGQNGEPNHFGMRLESAAEGGDPLYTYIGNFVAKGDAARPQRFSSPVKGYGFPNEIDYLYQSAEDIDYLQLIYEDALTNIYYLGPQRDYPNRIFIWGGEQPQDVGVRGQNAISALLATRSRSNGSHDHAQVEERVAYWLKELGLAHSFKLQPIAKGRREYEVKLRIRPHSPEVYLTDVGFGVPNLIPMLVLCYYAPKGSTIILEHPELHLHPLAQAGLADVLIDAINEREIKVILESHSEHLLRRLQRRIAEETFSNDDAALYFCKNETGASELEELKVNEYGYITNWPEDFFGDEMDDLVAQSKAATHRQRKKGTAEQENATEQEAAA